MLIVVPDGLVVPYGIVVTFLGNVMSLYLIILPPSGTASVNGMFSIDISRIYTTTAAAADLYQAFFEHLRKKKLRKDSSRKKLRFSETQLTTVDEKLPKNKPGLYLNSNKIPKIPLYDNTSLLNFG